MTVQRDLQERSKEIRWPAGFRPEDADYFSHNQTVIDAPVQAVWAHFVDASKWPDWYPLTKQLEILDGRTELSAGTRWHWTTFGLDVDATMDRFEPFESISWYGYGGRSEPTFYHSWRFEDLGAGRTLAIYDEVGTGELAVHMRQRDEGEMHRGHELMLAGLKWVSEKP